MTNRIPTPPDARTVIVGVDTHKHVHVAVAIDSWGTRLRDHAFVADSGGYQALITWAETHGRIEAFGIEGTGSYGASLARAVRRAGHRVVEVNRGDRRTRRAAGKSDTIDAEVPRRSPRPRRVRAESLKQIVTAREALHADHLLRRTPTGRPRIRQAHAPGASLIALSEMARAFAPTLEGFGVGAHELLIFGRPG